MRPVGPIRPCLGRANQVTLLPVSRIGSSMLAAKSLIERGVKEPGRKFVFVFGK
jgi:hypothetical protein